MVSRKTEGLSFEAYSIASEYSRPEIAKPGNLQHQNTQNSPVILRIISLKHLQTDKVFIMNSYEKILKIAKDMKPLKSHITAIGKIRGTTEDKVLVVKIDSAVKAMTRVLSLPLSLPGKNKTMVLENAPDKNIHSLIEYCEMNIPGKKPEWQILAEKNGWTPGTDQRH